VEVTVNGEERQNEYYHDDEIDLYDLWLTLKKRWSTILVITLVSTGIAFSYAYLAPKAYRVHNILVFNQMQDWDLFNQSEMAAAVSVLDKLNKITDLTGLEKDKVLYMLGMHAGDLQDIKNIKSSEIKGSNTLWVDIDTYDRNKGVALMEALPGFILSNPNISNRLKMQKALILKNREDLKAIIDNPTMNIKLSRDAVVYLPSIDLYALRERYNRINAMIEKMERGQLVSLAWKTESPAVPYKPNKIMSIFIGLVMGCIFGVLIAFFMGWVENTQHSHAGKSIGQ
jgi:LPS O-antigen subunit length determinant protein (WzzB/FepE family)